MLTGVGGLFVGTAAAAAPLRVELWGDSLSAQAADYFGFFMGASGKATAREHVYGGTAMCDWFPDMRAEIDLKNKTGFHPQAVLLQFSGNAFTPCMQNSKQVSLSGQALLDKYAADSAAAIAMFTKVKIPVYFASSPLSQGQSLTYTNETPLGVLYSKLPAGFPAGRLVRYVDAATPLEWLGKFSATLPCLAYEKCSGRWKDGTKTVVVRQSDGTHFCPVLETAIKGVVPTCPVPSPGAQRFALAMMAPVIRDFHLA